MQEELLAQRSLIDTQAKHIERQQVEIDRLHAPSNNGSDKSDRVALAARSSGTVAERVSGDPASPPDHPVGDNPKLPRVAEQAAAVPVGAGVLTHAGSFVLEPSLEYTNSSSNRLVFRGIELIPGIQIGQIEANSVSRDTIVAAATARYGLLDTLEFEVRLPYLGRSDRSEGVQQRDDATAQRFHLKTNGLGDIELGLRYQLNRPSAQQPIFVSSLRVKTNTGKSPFDVPFDDSGVATGLATGSGFWAVQPGLSVLLPSDPAVIFGGISYLYNIPRNINRDVGGVMVGRVDPGDAISGNVGFGFALNPRFSFSLGYEHTYILPMRLSLDGVVNRQSRLQIGSFMMGMSYRLTQQTSLNLGLEVGATRDAPDVSFVLRVPISPK